MLYHHQSVIEKSKTDLFIWKQQIFALKSVKWTSNLTGFFPKGSPKQVLCSVLCWQCKPGLLLLPVRQKPMLAGSQKGINYTLTDSQFWLQTQWVQHKQTLVSIHPRRWIKQHPSLSTPLISSLSKLLHFAWNLLTAFIVQFNIRDKNESDFFLATILLPQDAQLSFNFLTH